MFDYLLARVYRGSIAESFHRGHIAAVDPDGKLLARFGDPYLVTYARSSAKLLQAIPVVESGAAARFGLLEAELAVICASHNGEESHVDTVKGILSKIGVEPEHLACGPHFPFHEDTAGRMRRLQLQPTAMHNNCSGKHSGMLTLAKHLGYPLKGYMEPHHPVQKMMLQTFAGMAELEPDSIPLGTDGCGVPVYGIPLNRLAQAYARLGTGKGLSPSRNAACRTILGALREAPHFLAGSGRFDSRLIEATKGRIIGKMGAEGLFALTVPSESIGLVLKVEDGSKRALYASVLEALIQLKLIGEDEIEALREFRQPPVYNWRKEQVGRIEPCFKLLKS